MRGIVHKVGASFTLCGTALLLACTFAQAQRIDRDVNPVDFSVRASVPGIDERTNEPAASPKITKPPSTFSKWSTQAVKQPQVVKQPAATAVRSQQVGPADPDALSRDGSTSDPGPLKRPHASTTWGNQNNAKALGPDSDVHVGSLSEGPQFDGSTPAQIGGAASAGPTNFGNLFSSLSRPAALPTPFDRMPIGDTSYLSSSTPRFSQHRYRAVPKQPEVRPYGSVQALRTPLSDSQLKQKP